METRTVLFLLLAAVAGAACADSGPAEPTGQKQVNRLSDEARAERQRLASRQPVTPSAGLAPAAALDMAAALDIPAGMVVDARLTSPDPEAALVMSNYGVIRPRKGDSLVVLSTGRININHLPEPGTDFPPSGTENDSVTLRITINVPQGSNRLSFDYKFLSAEAPDFVNSTYNDMFTVRVEDGLGPRELASASVNSSFFFDVSETRAGGTGFAFLFADNPSGADDFPVKPPPGIPLFPDAGITNFRSVNVKVADGDLVTLEFKIYDGSDGFLDSTVVIDNVAFSGMAVVDPNPELIHDIRGTVVTNPAELATKGRFVQEVAADGVTQVLLRAEVPGPGQMQFLLPGTSAAAYGSVGAVGSPAWSNAVTVNAQQVRPGAYYVFALYTSPEDFYIGGDIQAKARPLRITARYTPTSGEGFELGYELMIVRPPVVLVHDIWSGCEYWKGSAPIYHDPSFDVTCADYSYTNATSLESNESVVPDAVYETLAEMRNKGVAVTQVDIIAHGMGGLLARRVVDMPSYRRSRNFNAGDFNRLIAMNTPHVGTRMADEIVAMREYLRVNDPDALRGLNNILRQVGIVIDGADRVAIDDLQTNSNVIDSIRQSEVPSHMLVSRGGLDIERGRAWGMLSTTRILYLRMESLHPLVIRKPLLGERLIMGSESLLFCDDQHDLFVAEADQKGGLTEDKISYFNLDWNVVDTEHFKIPSNGLQHAKLVELLNSSIKSRVFAPSIPSPRDVPRVNSCSGGAIAPLSSSGGSRMLPSSVPGGALRVVSPTAGTSVSPGSSVTVAVEASGGFKPAVVFIIGAGKSVVLEEPPFTAEFPVPEQAIGSVELFVSGIDEQGHMLTAEPVMLPVVSPASLTSIEVLNDDATLKGPGSTRRLVVLGQYDDGVTRNISPPSVGTLYSSSDTSVVTVTSEGLVTGVRPGIATITVRNGTTFTSITATIGDDSAEQCIKVRLGDYNLFVLEDYSQGHALQGRLAAGGNISLRNFSVGRGLPDTDTTHALVAGGNITLSSGSVWGDVWYGGQLTSNRSVNFARGTVSQGTPIHFASSGNALRTLSSRLAALPANGTTTLTPWGGVLLRGTADRVNVFQVDGSAFTGARLLRIEAPAQSLAVINIRGTSATFSGLGQELSGGIDGHGVLFNFPDATSISASDFGLLGTVLAPQAHITFNRGGWEGGIYARSLRGNAAGALKPLRDTDICR